MERARRPGFHARPALQKPKAWKSPVPVFKLACPTRPKYQNLHINYCYIIRKRGLSLKAQILKARARPEPETQSPKILGPFQLYLGRKGQKSFNRCRRKKFFSSPGESLNRYFAEKNDPLAVN